MLDLFSFGRLAPGARFSPAQIEQIRRTVHRAPEVMVKVTGGGKKLGAVAAHFAYISRKGELTIETDEGERVANRAAQRALLDQWHLELSTGQYRAPRDGRTSARSSKLVHNIVFSMPSPTPPDKVLAAARSFAREKFGLKHRYAMVLHTDQQHPHVHMVVKAESEHGQRLHIDKEMLRDWREYFAQKMREQGIAANATPRTIRGRTARKNNDAILRAHRHGTSTAVHICANQVIKELHTTGTLRDPSATRLRQTRNAVVANWKYAAALLDEQNESKLADEVRYFAKHLPPILTDKEILASKYIEYVRNSRSRPEDKQLTI